MDGDARGVKFIYNFSGDYILVYVSRNKEVTMKVGI